MILGERSEWGSGSRLAGMDGGAPPGPSPGGAPAGRSGARLSGTGRGRPPGLRIGGGLVAVVGLLPGAALAHPGSGVGDGGWPGALIHLLTGPDHLILMAMVGLAAAAVGRGAGILLCALAAGVAAGLHSDVVASPGRLGAFLLGTAALQAAGAGLALALGRRIRRPTARLRG